MRQTLAPGIRSLYFLTPTRLPQRICCRCSNGRSIRAIGEWQQHLGADRTQQLSTVSIIQNQSLSIHPANLPRLGRGFSSSPKTSERVGQKRKLGTKRQRDQKPRKESTQLRETTSHPLVLRTLLERAPLIDLKYVRDNFKVPAASDYPDSPNALFKSPIDVLSQRTECKVDLQYKKSKSQRDHLECHLRVELPSGHSETAMAHGRNKGTSSTAAGLQVLAALHEKGFIVELFPRMAKVTPETLALEAKAKIDIYNYAARFGLIPEFENIEITSGQRAGVKRKRKTVSISLKEQNINVSATSNEVRLAEIAACVEFKKEAEKFQAGGSDLGLPVNNEINLNTDNVSEFLLWYRLQKAEQSLLVNLAQSSSLNAWDAQAFLDTEPIGPSVTATTKKDAEALASLVASLTLLKNKPDLMTRFGKLVSKAGVVLLPVKPIDMTIDEDAMLIMQDALSDMKRAGLPKEKSEIGADVELEINTKQARHVLDPQKLERKSEVLQDKLAKFNEDPDIEDLRSKKAALPMSQFRDKVLKQIEESPYSIVIGATGSGKTTQVPQILLEKAISVGKGAECNIICTQPRRIAATSVAKRVAEERNESLSDTVGYHVRFDAKLPRPGGSITYCTTGILLQQLQHSPDHVMDNVSHIVLDEVHERDIIMDFLMVVLKKTIQARLAAGKSVPRVVLMSATIDSDLFSKYFQQTIDGETAVCPSISVPGRTFPVKEQYLEDILSEMRVTSPAADRYFNGDRDTENYLKIESSYKSTRAISENEDRLEAKIDWKADRRLNADGSVSHEKDEALVPWNLVAATIAHIVKTSSEGAILVFLPGLEDIKKVKEKLLTDSPCGVDFNSSATEVFILHSTVPASEQAQVFAKLPGSCRKIILSTNIAETSVTIPDIQYVVDTGKLREKRYDQIRRISRLQCVWMSKSNAKQRAGRAGRVQNGNYFALYSKDRFHDLRANTLPEILRYDLQEVCLDVKAQALKSPIREFLADCIEPPSSESVDASVKALQSLQALTDDENLTTLGRVLASLPIHPALGKMVVLASIFGCLDPIIILGAASNERSLFVFPPERRQEARNSQTQFVEDTKSDHFSVINAFRQMRTIRADHGEHAMRSFAIRNFIHVGAFATIDNTTKEIERIMVENGLIPPVSSWDRYNNELGHPRLNKNSNNMALVKGLALAGFYPNIAVNTGKTFRTPSEKHALLHPSTVALENARSHRNHDTDSLRDTIFTFSQLSKSADGNSLFLRDITQITPLITTLFGGRLTSNGKIINVDQWLPLFVKNNTAGVRILIEFRKAFDRVLAAAFKSLSEIRRNRQQNQSSFGNGAQSGMYLGNDPTRELLATSLAEVLSNDVYKPKGARSAQPWLSSQLSARQNAPKFGDSFG